MGMAAAEAASKALAAVGERSNAVATMIMSMQGAITLGHKSAMLDIIHRLRIKENKAYKIWRRHRALASSIRKSIGRSISFSNIK